MLYIIRWLTSSEFFVLTLALNFFFFFLFTIAKSGLDDFWGHFISEKFVKIGQFLLYCLTKLYHGFIKPQVVLEECHSLHVPGEGCRSHHLPGLDILLLVATLSVTLSSIWEVLCTLEVIASPKQTRDSSHYSTKQVHQDTYRHKLTQTKNSESHHSNVKSTTEIERIYFRTCSSCSCSSLVLTQWYLVLDSIHLSTPISEFHFFPKVASRRYKHVSFGNTALSKILRYKRWWRSLVLHLNNFWGLQYF